MDTKYTYCIIFFIRNKGGHLYILYITNLHSQTVLRNCMFYFRANLEKSYNQIHRHHFSVNHAGIFSNMINTNIYQRYYSFFKGSTSNNLINLTNNQYWLKRHGNDVKELFVNCWIKYTILWNKGLTFALITLKQWGLHALFQTRICSMDSYR